MSIERLSRNMWRLVDGTHGRTYESIPVHVPPAWVTIEQNNQRLYIAGVFIIVRKPYGKAFTYHASRTDGVRCDRVGHGIYSRLMDAKQACIRNAAGSDRRHYA